MNPSELLQSEEIIAAVISAILAFPIGILVTTIAQNWVDRKKKSQLTYSIKAESPLILARDELKDKLKVLYQGIEVKGVYYFSLRIANTGKTTVKDQSFTCLFSEGTRSIDPLFPKITTIPPREIDIVRDQSIKKPNELRYTIESLGPGQKIEVQFLTIENTDSILQVIFRNNPHSETSFIEGNIEGIANLEFHLLRMVISLILVYIIIQSLPIIGALIALPIIAIALPSLKPVISALLKKLSSDIGSKSPMLAFGEGSQSSLENVAGNNMYYINAYALSNRKEDLEKLAEALGSVINSTAGETKTEAGSENSSPKN